MSNNSKENKAEQTKATQSINHKTPETASKNESSKVADKNAVKQPHHDEHINLSQDETSVGYSNEAYIDEQKRRDLILSHKEAQAGSPDDMAALGEEDIGVGMEFLVTKDDQSK